MVCLSPLRTGVKVHWVKPLLYKQKKKYLSFNPKMSVLPSDAASPEGLYRGQEDILFLDCGGRTVPQIGLV